MRGGRGPTDAQQLRMSLWALGSIGPDAKCHHSEAIFLLSNTSAVCQLVCHVLSRFFPVTDALDCLKDCLLGLWARRLLASFYAHELLEGKMFVALLIYKLNHPLFSGQLVLLSRGFHYFHYFVSYLSHASLISFLYKFSQVSGYPKSEYVPRLYDSKCFQKGKKHLYRVTINI